MTDRTKNELTDGELAASGQHGASEGAGDSRPSPEQEARFEWFLREGLVGEARRDPDVAPNPFGVGELDKALDSVGMDPRLKSSDPDIFAEATAENVNQTNAHHFAKGYRPGQRIYLEIFAQNAGHDLSLDRIDLERWMDASIRGFRDGDHGPMRDVVRDAIAPKALFHEGPAHDFSGTPDHRQESEASRGNTWPIASRGNDGRKAELLKRMRQVFTRGDRDRGPQEL